MARAIEAVRLGKSLTNVDQAPPGGTLNFPCFENNEKFRMVLFVVIVDRKTKDFRPSR
ncbi:MAG: hypothetical protein ACI4CY_05230 [Candidatus Gastranaerophilaceae bacterium]